MEGSLPGIIHILLETPPAGDCWGVQSHITLVINGMALVSLPECHIWGIFVEVALESEGANNILPIPSDSSIGLGVCIELVEFHFLFVSELFVVACPH